MRSAKDGDWASVAKKINERLAILGLTQEDLAERAGISLSVVRELRNNKIQRGRAGRTLTNISEALGLDPQALAKLAYEPSPAPTDGDDRLHRIENRLTEIADQLGGISAELASVHRKIDIVWPNHKQ
jgi:transcriptional regulator with XRE-family HTH domain